MNEPIRVLRQSEKRAKFDNLSMRLWIWRWQWHLRKGLQRSFYWNLLWWEEYYKRRSNEKQGKKELAETSVAERT